LVNFGELVEHAEQVEREQQLRAAVGPRTDAEGEDVHGLVDGAADRRRHRLDLEPDRAGLLDRERVVDDLQRIVGGAPLRKPPCVMQACRRGSSGRPRRRWRG
jgi:hypothetical protein